MSGKRSAGKRHHVAAPYLLISAFIYLALIGVVYYGTRDHVYDGFPEYIPCVIAGLFLVMAVVRVIGFFSSLRAQRKLRKYDRSTAELEEADIPEDRTRIY